MTADVQYINSISRAIEIMRQFDAEHRELGIAEISKRLSLQKTTVFRVVKTLERHGWLCQNPHNSKYRLGYGVLEIAHNCYQNYDEKDVILPELKALRDEFNEDVILSVAAGSEAVCIERLESDNSLTIKSKVGRVLPMYCGATGKTFLPYQPPQVIEEILEKEKIRYTDNTRMTREALARDIEQIRQNGYAISVGEMDDGVFGVGVPLFGEDGKVSYCISLCGAVDRVEHKGVDRIVTRMLEVSRRLSKQISCIAVLGK